jgi:hypothetical protein
MDAALPPDLCAFGEPKLPSSSEKPIHPVMGQERVGFFARIAPRILIGTQFP